MEIIDRFDSGDEIRINFVIGRDKLIWNRDDDSMEVFLDSSLEYMNMYLITHGVYAVSDFCRTLQIKKPPLIYAYMGWTKEDTIKIDSHISDSQVMLSITCKFL